MNNVFKSSVDKNIMLTQYNHSDIIGNPHKQYISKDRQNADIKVRSLTTPYCYRIYSITLKTNNPWHWRAELEFNIYFITLTFYKTFVVHNASKFVGLCYEFFW